MQTCTRMPPLPLLVPHFGEARSWHPTPHFVLGLFDRYYTSCSLLLYIEQVIQLHILRQAEPSTVDRITAMSVSKAINVVVWACV
jgi:hypothetical protein